MPSKRYPYYLHLAALSFYEGAISYNISQLLTPKKMKQILTTVLFVFSSVLIVHAQSNPLIVNPGIVLLKDSSESKLLISTLNAFLASAQKGNEDNKFILEKQKVETFILLDEIAGIEKDRRFKDEFFYKPYLTNVSPIKDNKYLIQVSYIGTDNNVAYLRASFTLVAHRDSNSFLYSSPLIMNTKNWKTETFGNNIIHYENELNKTKLNEFKKLTTLFDKKLQVENKIVEFYCCDNVIELQRLVGVEYKSDYNGMKTNVWGAVSGNKKLIVLGNNNADFGNFDPHDLWHDRLSLVIQRSKVNKPVDEGCAYLYGGSWGLTWQEIFNEFKAQIASDKNTNWVDIKETPVSFKTKGFNNPADYIVNALLVQKIEKEKGFAGVWELMNVGPFEKGNEKYYKTLEKLTGITKENYNAQIWQLINNAK